MASHWYAIHVYSGFEKKVASAIREQAEQKGLGERFEQILVPTEEVVEVKRGAKVSSERKFFPGYVLIKMDLSDETWHLVKNTAKVTGFLGGRGRRRSARTRRRGSCARSRRGSNGRSRRSSSRSASRCASPTGRSPRSTASSRRSTRKSRGSRSRCRSLVGRPRSSSNIRRSRRCKPVEHPGEKPGSKGQRTKCGGMGPGLRRGG